MTVANAQAQLDRVLAFFPRMEAKASFLFATNIAMLAIALSNLNYNDILTWYVVLPLVVALFCAASAIFHVGAVVRPNLSGGRSSLVYFGSVCNFPEHEYVAQFSALSETDLESELLRQAHRNSEILWEKFSAVSKAMFWTTISVLPWSIFLLISSVHNSQMVKV